WLRVDTISEESGCYRNTVIAALDDLEKLGHIEDTGERKGLTRSIKTYRLKPGNQPARSSVKKHTAKQCGFSSEAVCKTAPVAVSKTTLLHEATTLDSETPKPIEAPKKLVVVEAGVRKAQATTTTNLDELIEELKPIYPNHDLGREFEKCRRY